MNTIVTNFYIKVPATSFRLPASRKNSSQTSSIMHYQVRHTKN